MWKIFNWRGEPQEELEETSETIEEVPRERAMQVMGMQQSLPEDKPFGPSSFNDVGVKQLTQIERVIGNSTDLKPDGKSPGSEFLELDTSRTFIFDGSNWNEKMSSVQIAGDHTQLWGATLGDRPPANEVKLGTTFTLATETLDTWVSNGTSWVVIN